VIEHAAVGLHLHEEFHSQFPGGPGLGRAELVRWEALPLRRVLHGHLEKLSFREKKQYSNRVRGVEVLSLLARVKNAKKGNFLPKLH
jgi:hypothetical protein